MTLAHVTHAPMPRKGSKGATFPVSEEWKRGVRLRLAALGWNQARLADEIGVTRAAVSWLLGPKAQLSSLVPIVEEKLGWLVRPREVTMIGDEVARATEGFSPEAKEHVHEIVDAMFGSPLQMELVAIFRLLSHDDQVKVVERARVLLEESNSKR